VDKVICERAAEFLSRLPTASVDACITDPIGLDNYGATAAVLSRILKRDGLLTAIVPNSLLTDVLYAVGEHLDYVWTCAMIQADEGASLWKPLVWWRKPGGTHSSHMIIPDVFAGPRPWKRLHRWQQSEHWVEFCLRQVPKGGLVIDPFVGTGTVGIVAQRMGYEFCGCDHDPELVAIARRRMGLT